MSMKRLVGSALLVAGLLSGCGGVDTEPQESFEAQEAALGGADGCPGEERTSYYSDATYTQQVGARYCDCIVGKGGWGVITPYSLYFYDTCPR